MAKGRDFKDWEVKWASRYGYDIFKMREQITKDFNNVESGEKFKAKLEAKGIVLCRGEKSQFVIILPWGQHKALSSMIHGRPTKAVLRRALADIDITKLPTVMEGKTQVKASLPTRKDKKSSSQWPSTSSIGSSARFIRRASRDYAGYLGQDPELEPKILKTGKGDKTEGTGGGAGSGMSIFKITKQSEEKKSTNVFGAMKAGGTGSGHGPNRRQVNMWVPVERRCKP